MHSGHSNPAPCDSDDCTVDTVDTVDGVDAVIPVVPVDPVDVESGILDRYCQVMLLGVGNSGKNQLSNIMSGGKFIPRIELTHGINTRKVILGHEQAHSISPGSRLVLSVSNFSGQEVYQQIHPIFFNENAIFVILYTMRSEIDTSGLKRHISNVCCRYSNARILLVGTHLDCIGGNPYLPLSGLKEQFPQIINTSDIRLSSLTSEGIDVFTNILASIAMDMEHVKNAKYSHKRLIESVLKKSTNLLHRGLAPTCASTDLHYSVEDINYLKDVGTIIVHNKTVILDPLWLAREFYRLVTANPLSLETLPKILTTRGILQHDEQTLNTIWTESKYTKTQHDALFFLIHSFGIATKKEESGNWYSSVPSLLPSMLPSDDGMATTKENDSAMSKEEKEVEVQLHLNFLPPDLWTLLMVELNDFVEMCGQTRTSTKMQSGHNHAILKMDHSKNTLNLIVCGPDPGVFRNVICEIMINVLRTNYPLMCLDRSLHVVCHVCHGSSQFYGRVLRNVKKGENFYCTNCIDDVVLDVKDLVSI